MVGRKKSSQRKRKPIPKSVAELYPYQQEWVDDPARFKLACKSRQIGYTFAATLGAVWERLEQPGLTVWLSASERQALEAMEQVRRHVAGLGAVGDYSEEFVEGTQVKQHQVRFANGSRLVALPANPDTVRGFAGDVVLDEFAFHRDSYAIWRAVFATATRGFRLEVISTPNGTQGKYYDLARQAGLVDITNGTALRRTHSPSPWSRHWCDIFTARSLGFGVDIESLRAAVDDEDIWQQEYCCQFLSDAANYLPVELVVAAEFTPAGYSTATRPTMNVPGEPVAFDSETYGAGPGYLGVDIGRRHDKTVLWLLEETDGILWTHSVRTLAREPFSVQRAAIQSLLTLPGAEGQAALVRRCCIDATGVGAMLAEELEARFGARVDPVSFTLAVKEDLAVRLKRLLEERRLRIPYAPTLRRALAAVKRYATPTGHFRFDAARTEEGHADEFWALALACRAAEHPGPSMEFLASPHPSAYLRAAVF